MFFRPKLRQREGARRTLFFVAGQASGSRCSSWADGSAEGAAAGRGAADRMAWTPMGVRAVGGAGSVRRGRRGAKARHHGPPRAREGVPTSMVRPLLLGGPLGTSGERSLSPGHRVDVGEASGGQTETLRPAATDGRASVGPPVLAAAGRRGLLSLRLAKERKAGQGLDSGGHGEPLVTFVGRHRLGRQGVAARRVA